MRFKCLFYFIFFFTLIINAQIDNQKKGTNIPAIEGGNDSVGSSIPFSIKPNQNTTLNALTIPESNSNFNVPKKEFSMFGETFGNPGELFEKRLNKKEDDLKPEGYGENSGLKEDAYWGDYRTKSKYIDIAYRDYGQIDGDLLQISVDDEVLRPREFLSGGYKGFRLELKKGLNKIDFYAINEGSLLPNTAEYAIIDEWKKLISSKIWALSKGVKVTVIIVKE